MIAVVERMLAVANLATCACLVAAIDQARAPASPAKARSEPSAEKAAHDREEERALQAFGVLAPSEQRDVCDYLELELERLDNFQMSLMRFVLKNQQRDSGLWPVLGAAPIFDPHEHAPGQPIARHALDPQSKTARDFEEQVFESIPKRRLASAFVYDYATRELRRTAELRDPKRIFRNALAGFPPNLDLCQALVEQMLDDGSQQKSLAAFAHAYTDREGNVYPGVTLYDAWTSGLEIEMPDVDTLGIIHDVLGDTKTWVAPVSADQHGPLYKRLGELYSAAHKHKSLRHALATTYLVGTAVLRDHYESNLDNFHALWDANQSTPETLAGKLPESERWSDFLAAWTKTCKSKPMLSKAGVARRVTLDTNAGTVRTIALQALKEFGAYERLDRARSKQQSSDPTGRTGH